MDFGKTMMISAAGLRVQGERMQVIAENIANADSVPMQPGEDPYRRKVLTFKNQLDRDLGIRKVSVGKIGDDNSEFGLKYDPGHPAADANGYIRTPNINSLIETMDMRQAQRSYEANMTVIEGVKQMLIRTIDMLNA